MKKLIAVLFLATSLQIANSENTNTVSTNLVFKTSTNYPTTKIETNNNWRKEAEKYPLYPSPKIYLKERGVTYSEGRR